MTKAELKKVLVIEKLVAGHIKFAEAAEFTLAFHTPGFAPQKTYITEGAEGFAHKNRGRKPAHTIRLYDGFCLAKGSRGQTTKTRQSASTP